MTILCLSDTHIGSSYEHRKDALADCSAVLAQVAAVAIERNASLVLHAGDAFHRAKPSPAELHVLRDFCAKLAAAEIPMIALGGNGLHDAAPGQRSALELFESRWVRTSRRPEYITEFAGVAVCTLPAAAVGRLVARSNGASREAAYEKAVALLVRTAQDLFGQAPDDRPRILLAHQMVSGAKLPTGLPAEQAGALVLPLEALEAIGYDAIVLGDIHEAQEFGEGRAFYCGSPQCHDFGEAAARHGCYLLEFGDEVFEGYEYEFVPLKDRRFVSVDIDLAAVTTHSEGPSLLDGAGAPPAAIPGKGEAGPGDPQEPHAGVGDGSTEPGPAQSGLDETDAIAAAIAERFPLDGAVVRVRYRAREEQHRRVDRAALERLVAEAGAHKLYGGLAWEPVRERQARAEGLSEALAPLEALGMWCEAQEAARPQAEALAALLGEWSAP